MVELKNKIERQTEQIASRDRELERLKLLLLEREAALDTVLNSKGWRLLNRYRGLRDRLLSRFLHVFARNGELFTAIAAGEYRQWIENVENAEGNAGRIEAQLSESDIVP